MHCLSLVVGLNFITWCKSHWVSNALLPTLPALPASSTTGTINIKYSHLSLNNSCPFQRPTISSSYEQSPRPHCTLATLPRSFCLHMSTFCVLEPEQAHSGQ